MARLDNTLLEAALLGYQAEQKRIQAAIADLQKRIGSKGATPKSSSSSSQPAARKKHRISAEGRARIAAAQRKRWAAAKKEAS
jgi:hypothetical protein